MYQFEHVRSENTEILTRREIHSSYDNITHDICCSDYKATATGVGSDYYVILLGDNWDKFD